VRRFCIFAALCLFAGGVFSANALDLIILRDGSVIEAKVMEISPTEIRYKNADNLNGPMRIIPVTTVLSIRYDNGKVEQFGPGLGPGSSGGQQPGPVSPLQAILNALPAIRIAGNSLKFEFRGDTWTARVNGENFSTGTVELEMTDSGAILTLKQTHIWPGAVGKTAGKVAGMVPGGANVAGALNAAGNIAGLAGAVEAPGKEIVLEYKAGPPAKLSLVRTTSDDGSSSVAAATANVRNNWISNQVSVPALHAYAGFGLDAGLQYERMLGSKLSLGAQFYWFFPFDTSYDDPVSYGQVDNNQGNPGNQNTSNVQYKESNRFPLILGIDAFFRFYPRGRNYYLGIALGYSLADNLSIPGGHGYDKRYDSRYVTQSMFAVTLDTGWKIDVGKEGGFFIQPGLSGTYMVGVENRQRTEYPVTTEYPAGYGGSYDDRRTHDSYTTIGLYFRFYFGMGFAF